MNMNWQLISCVQREPKMAFDVENTLPYLCQEVSRLKNMHVVSQWSLKPPGRNGLWSTSDCSGLLADLSDNCSFPDTISPGLRLVIDVQSLTKIRFNKPE
jgi:hypothetical protein